MTEFKKSIKIYFITILFSAIALSLGFYAYDPLQLFHKPWGRDTTFQENMRLQAAGIIKNYEFDSVIIGSSILENTSSREASKLFGGNFINLSLSGSTYFERLLVLRYMFKKHKINKVIFSLDAGSYIHQQIEYPKYSLSHFNFLYDDTVLNDIKAYLNYDFLKCLLTFSNDQQCVGSNTSLDRPNAWFDEEGNKVRYGGLDKWMEAKNNKKIQNVFTDIVLQTQSIEKGMSLHDPEIDIKILKSKQYVNKYLLHFIKENNQTDFMLVFPPYSRMYYALWAQYNKPYFEVHKAIVKYFVSQSEKIPNLKVFAFGDQDFLDDISNYKDPRHYHVSINSKMLSDMKQNIGELTQKNIFQYINTISLKAEKYDIISIGKVIYNYLKKSIN